MSETNNENNPFTGDSEGDTVAVREALIFTLMEALFAFLASVTPTLKSDRSAMRRVNEYKANQTVKAGKQRSMSKMFNISLKSITASHFVTLGLTKFRFVAEGRPIVLETLNNMHFFRQAVEGSQAVRRALAAIAAFDQWEASGAKAREEQRQAMQALTGQEVDEIPEGMTFANQEAIDSFGLKVGDFIRSVLVEQASQLRDSFTALAESLTKKGVSWIDNSGDRQRSVSREEYGEDSHLTVNIHSLIDWFKASVFTVGRYCSPCKRGGESQFTFGAQQVKAAGGCPQCGEPAHRLGKNDNTTHLPLLSPAGGLSTVGGWRVEMKSVILEKKSYNALEKAALGLITVEDAMKVLLAGRHRTRVQMETQHSDGSTSKKTVKVGCRLVPCLFEVQSGGSFQDFFGLAVEAIKQG